MRVAFRLAVLGLLGILGGSIAEACQVCHRPACAGVPACQVMPAYQCVTEMVPYTVMQTRTRVDWHEQKCTVMVPVPHTTWVERPVTICVPKFETVPVTHRYTVCRLVPETTMVNQTVTVCDPVQSTQMVTETSWQATTRTVAVPVRTAKGCGLGVLCGKRHGAPCTGCQYVTQTCYNPVPVTRAVTTTSYVPRTVTRAVPVTTCRWVSEEKVVTTNVVRCLGIEQRQEMKRFPCTTVSIEAREISRMIPTMTPECVPVTCYRPVTRVVPVTYAPAAMPSIAPSGQGASGQSAAISPQS